jgi:CubicO group peptidase (beta-lactamase class C family)
VESSDLGELIDAAVGDVYRAAQLVVVDRGRTVVDAAAGDCARETLFDVASLTKALVTTTLAMRLHEAGRLPLERELRPGVTVRLALAHAGGLPGWRPLHRQAAGAADPRRAIVEAARSEPLEAEPGTRAIYSDLGFLLLGDAIEQAGEGRLDALWAPLADRLGVEARFVPDPSRCAPARIGPSGELRGVVHDENAHAMGGVAPHAGLFASAGAVSSIARALVADLHGGKGGLVGQETIRRFWSPSGVPGSSWCLGWDRPSPGASQAGARWPREGVGHLGFTGCSLWIDPPRERWVVLLSNRVLCDASGEKIKALRPRLHDAAVAALDG